MAKASFKTLLVEKGEKIALLGAGAVMLLFAIMGIVELGAATNPADFEKEVLATTQKIESTVNGAADPQLITPLETMFIKSSKLGPVTSSWANNLFFDPIAPPDKRRINPIVLPVAELQADYIPAKILAYDLQINADGQPEIGVLTQISKKADKLDAEKSGLVKEISTRFNFRPNMGKGQAGNIPQPKVNIPRPPGASIEGGLRESVEYVPLEPEKFVGKRLALTIFPQRMVIVQGSFPYKAQIEEIQKALRLETPMEVFGVYGQEETPLFRGVIMQRQILELDGKTVEVPWHDLEVSTSYQPIRQRKYGDRPEDPTTNYVLLHRGHRLTMPLPHLLAGKYPDIRMESIKNTINAQQKLRRPPEAPKLPNQFADGDVFEPVTPNSAGTVGQPNIGGEGFVLPKGPMPPFEKAADPATAQAKFDEVPDYILIRLIDNDIEPGRLYQYRMKMLMMNPNWMGLKDPKRGTYPAKYKADLVSRPSDAEVMLLGADVKNEAVIKQRFGLEGDELRKNIVAETPWTELKGGVSVPREEFLFAIDPISDGGGRPLLPLKPGQGLIQIQRWLPIASIGAWKEPVADWVVADIVATRGTYLGGRQYVNLPLWSSQFNRYILREAPPDKGKPRRGVLIDPTKPGPTYVVADVEGGYRLNRPLTRQSSIEEYTAAEILLIDEQGKLLVRSSYADRGDTQHYERENAWRAWIDRAEKETQQMLPNTTPMNKGGFQ